MNDPTANRIPAFRHDYEGLKRQVLRASEDILLAANCCSHLRFGYIVITSDRLVYVTFDADQPGRFGFSRGISSVKINGVAAIETRLVPTSRLTAGEEKSRRVFEMRLDHLIRVERLQDVVVAAGGQMKRVVRLALRVLRESTFDVDLFPRLLIFWDPLDGARVYDALANAETSHKLWFDKTAPAGIEIAELARPYAQRPALESSYMIQPE